MSAVSAYLQKSLLDWTLLGASPSRPTAIYFGVCTGVPNSTAASEIAAGSGYSRVQASFSAASDGAAILANRINFGPFSSAAALKGVALFDASFGGNYLWGSAYSYSVAAGQSISAAPGSLTISLQ